MQQEIDLQDRIRDELVVEYNSKLADENEKRKIQAKIANVDEKVQALGKISSQSSQESFKLIEALLFDCSGALTLLYCSGKYSLSIHTTSHWFPVLLGLQYCCAQMELTNYHSHSSTDEKDEDPIE